jgi:hypothetical protein
VGRIMKEDMTRVSSTAWNAERGRIHLAWGGHERAQDCPVVPP